MAGGETGGEIEGRLLSVTVEGLGSNEIEGFAPGLSGDSGESACGGCGCWCLAAAFLANVFSFALLHKSVSADREG
jgi:hypothetical protein